MRTPRTVDEIADAILPASIDGIHERALCLLLAEYESDIAELREQLPKLPPGEWTRESVAEFNAAKCESGEDAQASAVSGQAIPYMSNDAVKSADDGLRAPGSTAPAPSHDWQHDTFQPAPPQWETDARWLEAFGGDCGPGIAKRLCALAADRDRLERIVAKDQEWAALASCNSVEEMHAEMGNLIDRGNALQRRLDEMATREPTDDQLDTMYRLLGGTPYPVFKERWAEVFRYVRNTIFANATPASEPNPNGTWVDDQVRAEAGLMHEPMPHPSPATPSDTADGIEPWRSIVAQAWNSPRNFLKVMDPDLAEDIAQLIYTEVSRREAGLRENREYWRNACIEAQQHRDGANAQIAEFERDLAAARAQLAAATERKS